MSRLRQPAPVSPEDEQTLHDLMEVALAGRALFETSQQVSLYESEAAARVEKAALTFWRMMEAFLAAHPTEPGS